MAKVTNTFPITLIFKHRAKTFRCEKGKACQNIIREHTHFIKEKPQDASIQIVLYMYGVSLQLKTVKNSMY